jgi:hypothetical protein
VGGRDKGLAWSPVADEASRSPSKEARVLRAQLAATEDEIIAMKARVEELEKKG